MFVLTGTEILNEDSQEIVRQWGKFVRRKHKNEKDDDANLYEDPLLLIEWDQAGLAARILANPLNTNLTIANRMYKTISITLLIIFKDSFFFF